MKLSVSLRFTTSQTFGRIPWAGNQLVARPLPVYKHRKTNTYTQTPNVHALSRIRIHDPGFQGSEDSSCLRSLVYRDRQLFHIIIFLFLDGASYDMLYLLLLCAGKCSWQLVRHLNSWYRCCEVTTLNFVNGQNYFGTFIGLSLGEMTGFCEH
jgi:hypothetical protein